MGELQGVFSHFFVAASSALGGQMHSVLKKSLLAAAVLCATGANAAVVNLFEDASLWTTSGPFGTGISNKQLSLVSTSAQGSSANAILNMAAGTYRLSLQTAFAFPGSSTSPFSMNLGGSVFSIPTLGTGTVFANPYTFSTAGGATGFNFALGQSTGGLSTVILSVTQVPGPLPLLGALAAFGWSRKLRKKISDSNAQPALA
ncbi:MAG: hypothetical protein JNJ71_17165 [Rubrivivax sp.]|nr:hypothetical protein [Rubrivivax sp.]